MTVEQRRELTKELRKQGLPENLIQQTIRANTSVDSYTQRLTANSDRIKPQR